MSSATGCSEILKHAQDGKAKTLVTVCVGDTR